MSEPTRDPPNVIRVTDADDPRLDAFRDVRDRDLRGPDSRPGLFMVEAALPVETLLAQPGRACSVLIAPNWVDRIAPQAPPDVPVYVATPQMIESIAGFHIHRGVLAVGRRPEPPPLEAIIPPPPAPATVLLTDDIGNIDNMGMLFRNAAAFAVDAVLLSPRSHDPLYRKCVRVSIGHVLRVPWTRSDDWPGDLQRLRNDHGLTLLGASAGAGSMPMSEIEPPARVGLIVGREYEGLTPAARDACDHLVRIPMAKGVDSLNVAVAAAICLARFSRGETI